MPETPPGSRKLECCDNWVLLIPPSLPPSLPPSHLSSSTSPPSCRATKGHKNSPRLVGKLAVWGDRYRGVSYVLFFSAHNSAALSAWHVSCSCGLYGIPTGAL